MPFQVGRGSFPAAISGAGRSSIARSDTPPEVSAWEKIKAFFCPTHKSEALKCIRQIYHPSAGTTLEDVASRFEQLRRLAYAAFEENIQSGRHGVNHFCILDENNREMLLVTLDDAGWYTVECEGYNKTYNLTMVTEQGEECTEDYEAVWSAWESAAPAGESIHRAAGVQKMRNCLNNGNPELDLNDFPLTSLPDHLPPNLTVLKTIRVPLNNLPTLPEGLKVLLVNRSQLTNLPALPEGLQELGCVGNQLPHLPALPKGLQSLDVENNRLISLPALPEGLQSLDVENNQLTDLPTLPEGLKSLDIENNQLTSLPALPEGLQNLDVESNQLTSLPDSIARLSSGAIVNLSGNPLSERTRQSLRDMTSVPGYSGPAIHFSMDEPSDTKEIRSLHLAVADWLTIVKKGEPAPTDRWLAYGQENDAAPFSAFIDRLSETENYKKDKGFKAQIASWLALLAEDDDLRAKTFAMTTEVTSSCEDRVTLALNQMKNVQLVHNAEKGEYDNNLPELVSVGRKMFRLETLEKIARDKVKTLHFVDEIEVYLGYQNKLKEALALTSVAVEMRFFGVSHITESDLKAAERQVKNAEKSEFREWILQWEPLRSVLKRTASERWEALCEKKISDYDNKYRMLSDTELKPAGLVGNTDAERAVGARALESAEQEFHAGLRPLADRLLGALLH